MDIEQIIYEVLKNSTHTWVRHWISKETSGFTFPGEYIEIRSSYLSGETLKYLFDNDFNIETIKSQQINADIFSDVLLKRGL